MCAINATNDCGFYNLRNADKGYNLKNKSGDNYTPLGPAVIDAEGIDPAQLRVRTWVNGKIVQDDTTEDLVFPFGQLVADLSQMMTRSEEHTSELQSRGHLVCRLLLEKKNN